MAIGQDDADAVAALKKSYPDIAGLRWPALVALDETGKVLGSIELSLSVADTRAGSAQVVVSFWSNMLSRNWTPKSS